MKELLLFEIIFLFIKYPMLFIITLLCGLFIYLIIRNYDKKENNIKENNIKEFVKPINVSKSTQTNPIKSDINYILN